MIIQCTTCLAKFKFDEEKLASGPKKVRCSKCGNVFTVVAPELVNAPSAPADVPASPSRVPTDYNLLRTPTQETSASGSVRNLLETPIKARRPTGEQIPPSASGKRRALTQTTPAPRTQSTMPKAADTLQPSFTTLTSITAQSDEPEQPILEKGDSGQIDSTWAARGESPPTPAPAGWSEQQQAAQLTTASVDPTAAPRPAKQEQHIINDEMYKASDRALELPPLLKVLKEIDFDSTEKSPDDLLELDIGREFEYGGESARITAHSKHPKLTVRPLTGIRDDSTPMAPNLSKAFSATVKALLLLLILATLALSVLVLKHGDRFNITDLTSISGLERLIADPPASDTEPNALLP